MGERRTEFSHGLKDPDGVFGYRFDPEIQIFGGVRLSVEHHGEAADHEESNLAPVENAQQIFVVLVDFHVSCGPQCA